MILIMNLCHADQSIRYQKLLANGVIEFCLKEIIDTHFAENTESIVPTVGVFFLYYHNSNLKLVYNLCSGLKYKTQQHGNIYCINRYETILRSVQQKVHKLLTSGCILLLYNICFYDRRYLLPHYLNKMIARVFVFYVSTNRF